MDAGNIKSENIEVKCEPSNETLVNGDTIPVDQNGENGHIKPEIKDEPDNAKKPKKHKDKEKKKKEKNKHKDKSKKEKKEKKHKRKAEESDDESSKSIAKKVKTEPDSEKKKRGRAPSTPGSANATPVKRVKKEEEPVWEWWKEEKLPEGQKWRTLEHKGIVLAPPYERLPETVKFYYDGKAMRLSAPAEEVATFYAKMLDHDYTSKEVFNKNFFNDWRKYMTKDERETIKDLKRCNFKEMHEHFKAISEARKNRSKEEKKEEKLKQEALIQEYGFAMVDGHKQRVGNFRIEPPGLFRGRGEHPKMGMVKKRVFPEDIIINCSKGFKVPCPEGHKWREVRHDTSVTWLASWTENVQNAVKYVMLAATSRLKGEKDWMKYEKARHLHTYVDKIREDYIEQFKAKEMVVRQRAVALYFIDKLALRAGNEKDSDEAADTVGCCSIRVEHITLHNQLDDKEFVVEFDFLGKDSIRYHNFVPVDKRVFKNLHLFMENKDPGDDLFDRLNTASLNQYLSGLMPGLTAKVFRTYNASKTLQEQLDKMTNPSDSMAHQVLTYNRANREVAILCNHQRAVPKGHEKSMENLQAKLNDKKNAYLEAKQEYKKAKETFKKSKLKKDKDLMEKKKGQLGRVEEQLSKLSVQITDKDENKEIALGTSKLNYLDPRITVAWCKRVGVPIEKCFNKTQREKFAWAIAMADETYSFTDVSNLTLSLDQLNSRSEPDQPTNNSQDADEEEEDED